MHILSLTFWLVFQSFAASRQAPEKVPPTATNIIFQSVDGGQTWQDVSAGLTAEVTVGQIFVGDGTVFLAAQNGLYRNSHPSGTPVWENQTALPEQISGIFPGRNGTYACSYGGGIFQEQAGTWLPRHGNLKDKYVHTLLETPDGSIFVGCQSGIFKSVDSGKTWKRVFDEGRVWSITATDGVLVGGAYRGVLRSTDGGEHWDWVMTEDGAAVNTELIEGGVAAVTYDGSTQRLCTSTDAGKTWQHVEAESVGSVQSLNNIKQLGANLFCTREAGIFRSADQGKTWQLVLPVTGKRMYQVAVSGRTVYAVRVSGC